MKTPYRYIEEQHSLLTQSDVEMSGTSEESHSATIDSPETYPSPLLMVVIDQACAKVNPQKPIDPSIHPVIRFLRRLFLWLASKVPSLTLLYPLVNHLKSGLRLEEHLLSDVATVFAIKEEVQALTVDLARIEGSADIMELSPAAFIEAASGSLRRYSRCRKFLS